MVFPLSGGPLCVSKFSLLMDTSQTELRPTPMEKEMATHSSTLLSGEFHGWRNLVGYSPRDHKETDTTK